MLLPTNQIIICPHSRDITTCEVCQLIKKQYGNYPSADNKMEKEIADMEDQLINTDRRYTGE